MVEVLDIKIQKADGEYIVRVPNRKAYRSKNFLNCLGYIDKNLHDDIVLDFILSGEPLDSYQVKALQRARNTHNVNYCERELLILSSDGIDGLIDGCANIKKGFETGIVAEVMAFDNISKKPRKKK